MSEVMLDGGAERFVLFPLQDREIWDYYKKHVACFWTAEEVDFSKDRDDFARLKDNERRYVEHVLAFFAAADGVVLENLAKRFMSEVTLPEARCFYGFQAAMENIHSECYSLMIETLVADPERRAELFAATERLPCVRRKAQWAQKWMDADAPFAERLVAFAVVEGVFFSGAFCAIFWLRKKGLMPGLTFSNELISRDEGLHTDFACLMHSKLRNKAEPERIRSIVEEAVDIELDFVRSALPVALLGMNAELMSDYIRFVADRLMRELEQEPIYGSPNPFPWMELISLQGKSNFFEKRVGEYARAGMQSSSDSSGALSSSRIFDTEADF